MSPPPDRRQGPDAAYAGAPPELSDADHDIAGERTAVGPVVTDPDPDPAWNEPRWLAQVLTAMRPSDLPSPARAVLMKLASDVAQAEDTGVTRLERHIQAGLVDGTAVAPSTVQKWVRELERRGWVEVFRPTQTARRRGAVNRYMPTCPDGPSTAQRGVPRG